MSQDRQYIAIDLKSFYASVECVERGLDPLDANLVVADRSRTEKTICLAVSPALKRHGIPGRPRLFEVVQRVREINRERNLPRGAKMSRSAKEIEANPDVGVDYIVAPPRMAHYINYSTQIYNIYLEYIAAEDIHVYSIDEVFIDATAYLRTYKMTAHELALKMIRHVLKDTGITATAGIGSNMYLCKVAMDIMAKKMAPDADGVRIAELDEKSYRRQLWDHLPLTDFWRVGGGTARKLAKYGIFTMGDIARCSLHREAFLYRLFGVNAELLIDHAWGYEPVTMKLVKSYRPTTHSVSSGQVLTEPYTVEKARVVVMEMADAIGLDLLDKGLATDQLVVQVGYDATSLTDRRISALYEGPVTTDHYGRRVPAHSHGTVTLKAYTASSQTLIEAVTALFDSIVNPVLMVRRLTISANRLQPERYVREAERRPRQLNLFIDYEQQTKQIKEQRERSAKERRMQAAMISIKKQFGKNAVLKGLNYLEGATQRDRNGQIGGHKA